MVLASVICFLFKIYCTNCYLGQSFESVVTFKLENFAINKYR